MPHRGVYGPLEWRRERRDTGPVSLPKIMENDRHSPLQRPTWASNGVAAFCCNPLGHAGQTGGHPRRRPPWGREHEGAWARGVESRAAIPPQTRASCAALICAKLGAGDARRNGGRRARTENAGPQNSARATKRARRPQKPTRPEYVFYDWTSHLMYGVHR